MDDQKLGCRSLLVLMKLGFDLRSSYEDVIVADMPPELKALSDKLVGYVSFRDLSEDDA